MDKHPASEGQVSRDILCWREHVPGYICMLKEGHSDPNDRVLIGSGIYQEPYTDASFVDRLETYIEDQPCTNDNDCIMFSNVERMCLRCKLSWYIHFWKREHRG